MAYDTQHGITTENIVFSMTTRKEPYENEYAKTLYEIPGKTPLPPLSTWFMPLGLEIPPFYSTYGYTIW